jgi:threonine aldolase
LAAAAILSLDNRSRLAQDHEHAKAITQVLLDADFEVKTTKIPTNMVFFKHRTVTSEELVPIFDRMGIKISYIGWGWVRLVTHLDFLPADLVEFKKRIRQLSF